MGNPAAAGSFPASQRLRRCARQGVGAVAEPSGVDDARQDRPRYGLAERFGGAGIVAREVGVAQGVHELAGRLAAGESRAEAGRVVHVTVDGLLAPW